MKENSSNPEYRSCPLCNIKPSDMLKHLRLLHSIENTEQLEREINEIEKKKKKQEKFATYVDDLKAKIQKNEITYDEYKQLISKWVRETSR